MGPLALGHAVLIGMCWSRMTWGGFLFLGWDFDSGGNPRSTFIIFVCQAFSPTNSSAMQPTILSFHFITCPFFLFQPPHPKQKRNHYPGCFPVPVPGSVIPPSYHSAPLLKVQLYDIFIPCVADGQCSLESSIVQGRQSKCHGERHYDDARIC